MRRAETVLGVLRERGRRGLPLERLYRHLYDPQLYLLAYGKLYSNKGAMTPGADAETVDGMTLGKIGRIIDALRHERYRFRPARRVYIVRRAALRCIPDSLGRNLEEHSWVTGLTWRRKPKGTAACPESGGRSGGVQGDAPQDPRDMAKAGLLEAQSSGVQRSTRRNDA